MKHVFDNEEGLLSDLMGDPQESLQVQQYIANYLQGAAQARTSVKEQLRRLGTKALPGMMQSILSRWSEISKNHSICELLKELVKDCCENNSCAREFIVRSGIQKNPFPESRKWLIKVFSGIVDGSLSTKERDMLNNPFDAVRSTSKGLTEFIPLILTYDPDNAFRMAIEYIQVHLKSESVEELNDALCLLQMFEGGTGANVGELIKELFANIPRSTEGYIEDFTKPLESHPLTFTNATITPVFAALDSVLQRSQHKLKRDKYVQYYFVSSVRNTIKQNVSLLTDMDTDMRRRSQLVKYWFHAIFGEQIYKTSGVQKLYCNMNLSDAPDYYLLQLFVQYILGTEKWHTGIDKSWVHSIIEPLQNSHGQIYRRAEVEAGQNKPRPQGGRAHASNGGAVQ